MKRYTKAIKTTEELRSYVYQLPLPEKELDMLWNKIVHAATCEWYAGIEHEKDEQQRRKDAKL